MTKEALKQALEALKNNKKVREGEGGTMVQPVLEDAAIAAIKEALAQPEQEQEPVEWVPNDEWLDIAVDAAMAQQEKELQKWVGLTDEEMNVAMEYWSDKSRSAYGGAYSADGEYVSMIDTWRYIEAKLKEKNT
jgi:hypothetical protein